MKQYDIILKAMLTNKDVVWWYAKNFQQDPYFVGYEASARMSELANMYPEIIISEKDGRFRTLRINWKKEKEIKKILKEKGW